MVHVTYREQLEAYADRLKEELDRNDALCEELKAAGAENDSLTQIIADAGAACEELRERAEKAELDLRVAKHETKMAQEAVLLREADNVALREGLHRLVQHCESANVEFSYQDSEALLAAPDHDPGAKVRAVYLAAIEKVAADDLANSKRPHTDEWCSALLQVKDADEALEKAVRALRGKEGEGDE